MTISNVLDQTAEVCGGSLFVSKSVGSSAVSTSGLARACTRQVEVGIVEGCAGFSPAIGSDGECDTLMVGMLVDGTLVGALVAALTDTKPWPPEDAKGTR